MLNKVSHFNRITTDSRKVYKALNGVFTVYKPSQIWFDNIRRTIIQNLCKGLNSMNVRPPKKYISIEGETNKDMKVIVQDSFADDPLVVGPRYQLTDFKLICIKIFDSDISGVVVCGINKGTSIIHKLQASKSIRHYKVKGLLGQATNNYFHTGKIVERSTYRHVRRGHIDKLCSAMQSSHQKKMFELCGVDIQSQTAYELAIQGPIRPSDSNIPMIYTIKCIHFSPPEFTLEIVCTSESDMYLKTIVHELGMQLRTTATCVQLLCIQDGIFHINHALLQKHWTVQDIINNMQMCKHLIDGNETILHQTSAALLKPSPN